MIQASPYGTHRVLEPLDALPQAALRLDNDFSKNFENEILLDVEVLNIDAASFRQLAEAASSDPGEISRMIVDTVKARGKQHNPVTDSGGMLLGKVVGIGSALRLTNLKLNDRIASLCSLTLTPLRIDEILSVNLASAQVRIRGQAVLFESSPYAVLPQDMPEEVALAALDVCGAAPQVARLCRRGDDVLILGVGGKSGLISAFEARRRVQQSGMVIGVEYDDKAARDAESLQLCDVVVRADVRDALGLQSALHDAGCQGEYNKVISCVNVERAEMAAILATRKRGKIYFFAMTTQFGRAALGAEGVGKDIDMLIGNGYAEGHAEYTLDLLRQSAPLRKLFIKRYG